MTCNLRFYYALLKKTLKKWRVLDLGYSRKTKCLKKWTQKYIIHFGGGAMVALDNAGYV